ncbi:hypothetical protein [Haloplanus rubicundus]|nr:hypothetical protein [Haloplanus rubicundus]
MSGGRWCVGASPRRRRWPSARASGSERRSVVCRGLPAATAVAVGAGERE